MRLTIFGASGKTGRHLVEQALDAGHTITAVVRDPARLSIRHQRLKLVVADVLDPAAIQPAVAGADAVVSTVGPRSYRQASRSCRRGRPASWTPCARSGTSRLVVVSAAPVASDDHDTTLPYRLLVAPLRHGLADMAVMEETIRRSGMAWTILRPSRLTDGRRTGTWRQARDANLRRGYAISEPT